MVVVRLPALHCVVAVAACLALLGGGVAGKSVQQGTISPLYHNSVHARAPAGAWLDSSSPVYSQPVQSLVALLQRNASIRVAIETSIHDAYVAIPSQERDRFYGKFGLPRVRNLAEYLLYLEQFLYTPPGPLYFYERLCYFYWMIGQPAGLGVQTADSPFSLWLDSYMNAQGAFLDSTASALYVSQFAADPAYNIDDYISPPSGFLTLNQFFARSIKPWLRRVEHPDDHHVVVSPADCHFEGLWRLGDDSTVTLKRHVATYLKALMADSKFADEFRGGWYTHAFLNVTDLHRYYAPVDGEIKEARVIQGRATLLVEWDDAAKMIQARTTRDWQHLQARGVVVAETVFGPVAYMPIGMAQISSVRLSINKGDVLRKGEEFGYFQFGGSDIILLFNNRMAVTPKFSTTDEHDPRRTMKARQHAFTVGWAPEQQVEVMDPEL